VITTKGWPLRARLPLMAGGSMALMCLLAGLLVIMGIRGEAADQQRAQTFETALSVTRHLQREDPPRVLPAQPDGTAIQVVDPSGRVISATGQLAGKPPMADFRPTGASAVAHRELCPPRGMDACMDVVGFQVYTPSGERTVYAANRTVPWYVSGALVAFLVALSLLLILLVMAVTSRTINRTLAPVEAIRAELAEITASDAGRRVPVPESRDEIRLLAQTVNATLQRLDAALVQMRRFTADASHDLRTPIAAARARVEEALLYPDETDWPAMATDVLESLNRLQAIVTDLLELAALDSKPEHVGEEVNLTGLIASEIARQPRRVPVHTDLAPEVMVRGDPLRLTRLLVNLLDNAERHANSEIRVTLRAENGTAVMEVLDDGAGIPPEHRETVFQRFARLDAARNRDAGGTGLGLPIARQTAAAHGGTLAAEDSPQGARLVLRLPLLATHDRPR